MTRPERSVTGMVLRLRCNACGAVFPHFLFSGDEDGDTVGLCSASCCDKSEVVILEAEPSEWNNFESAGILAIEERLALQFGRADLKVLRLLRVEHEITSGTGLSFRDFKKAYQPSVLVYSCACCAEGESRAIEELTVGDFQKLGGRIFVAGKLTL